jgi:L-malate glycosyltransferase
MTASNVHKGKQRILVICPFPEGVAAGQRLKYEQYFDDWRKQGFDVTVSSYMDKAMWDVVYQRGHYPAKVRGVLRGHLRRMRDMLRIHQFDVVYVFMWVTPFGTPLLERVVRRQAKRLVYDIEDNVLMSEANSASESANPIMRLLKGPGKARFLVRAAEHVITSSPFLNDTCMAMNEKKSCTYISSSIDTDRFQPKTPYSNDKPVVIGWTGTFSSKPYLDLLRDVFVRLAKKVDFTLRVIGNFDYELAGVNLEVVRWSAAREVEDLQALDIGVYPLPVNDWVFGKSGLKAIQYMAFALPCVATNIGMTPRIIEHHRNGLLVRTDDEWVAALEQLVREPDLRKKLGQAARKDAEEKYSLHAIAGQYRAVLNAH